MMMMMMHYSLSFLQLLLLSHLICIFIILSCVTAITTTSASGNESDRLSLLDFKNHFLAGATSGALSSWNDSVHFCQWQGVVCSHRHLQRITDLSLSGEGLYGSVPPSIGNLTFLRRLKLSSNKLHGTIPKEISHLQRLEHLDLSENSLSGAAIPLELTNYTSLKNITFHHNNFSGEIPFQVGFMLKLQELWLGYNGLTGTIPSSIGNLTSLYLLSLRRNSLEGGIPHEIGQLKKGLKLIELTENYMSGMIPSSFCNLSSLQQIRLISNNFSGNLMPNLGICFPNLQKIGLGINQFTGTIPASLLNISRLELIDVAINRLNGRVPDNIGVLKNIYWFNINSNNLGSGEPGGDDLRFLTSLTNLSRLSLLSIGVNNFGAALPTSIVNLSTELSILSIAQNQIHGSIPAGVSNLFNLRTLDLCSNQLTGVIPSSIGKFKKLFQLCLGGNMMSGPVPSSLGNLTQLIFLSLAANNLKDSIPSSLANCKNMEIMDLANNKLSGNIPHNFFGLFDRILSLHLYQNSLTGILGADVGNLKSLGELDISDNRLSGQIPSELGNCLKLEVLSLAGNFFQGSIPNSISSLKSIQQLNLSRNNLSGMIPKDLQNLLGLRNLNLSFNQLEGEVPTKGVFSNASEISLDGNRNQKLCGGVPQLKLPACTSLKGLRRKVNRLPLKYIMAIVISGIVILSSMILTIIYWKKRNPRSWKSLLPSLETERLRVSYQQLHRATQGFSPSNLIGEGSFGFVYKGILSQNEPPVAVKVLNLQRSGASRSFVVECEALRRIRHRNLLKILTSCSTLDPKGNDFMALVFEFMPNGSLESWMHASVQHEHQTQNLSVRQRLDIAIGVASGLDYLHHHCETPIIHCDLKPSNVLLDENFTAHLGDFGLAKLLPEATRNFTTSSATIKGSIGYIPPEYGMGGEASTFGDVYSFGIILLEMVTGKRPTDDLFKDGLDLHGWCKMAYPERVGAIVDPFLLNDEARELMITRKQVVQCLASIMEVGLACSAELRTQRIDIHDALTKLHQTKQVSANW